MQDYITIRSIYLNRDYRENFSYKSAYEIFKEVFEEWNRMTDDSKNKWSQWAKKELEKHGFVYPSEFCKDIIYIDYNGNFVSKSYNIGISPSRIRSYYYKRY